MKPTKKNILFIAILFLVVLQSCKEPIKKDTNLHLVGKVLNHKKPIVSFIQAGTDNVYYDSLDANGNFSIIIEDIEEGYFFVGKEENSFLYLMAGDTTEVVIDEEKYDSLVRVGGDFAEINNYLMASEKIKISNDYWFSLSDSALNIRIDSLYKEKRSLLSKKTFSKTFSEKENLRLYTDSIYDKNTISWEGVDRSELLFFKNLNLNDFVQLPNYFVSSVLNSLVQIEIEPDTVNIMLNMYSYSADYTHKKNNFINKKISSSLYKDALLKSTMTYFVERTEIDSVFKEVYDYGIKSITDKRIKEELQDKYESRLRVAKGSKHPIITFKNTKGNIVKTTDSIFKNKLIYIDVWATWCPPCVGETSSFIALSKKYEGKDIVFVGISFDNERSYDKWMPYVNSHELLKYSIQGIAQNNIKKKFDEDYLISGIPRFILIDKKGNIIDADAPRPSDKDKIINLINNHL